MSRASKDRKLRRGYTTGACAAAAAKGALLRLLGRSQKTVEIELPGGEKARMAVKRVGLDRGTAFCAVVKDAGDDPDVTNGAVIGASVRITDSGTVRIAGGEGVGRVTRAGLAVPPGRAAINPVPRRMIREAVKKLLPSGKGAAVTINVENGKRLAEKTLNARLGIVGGLSILGTTGVVEPYSQEAYRESLQCALDVVRAQGLSRVVLSTGKNSEKKARSLLPDLPEAAFVLMADHFHFAVRAAVERGIRQATVSCFPGKLVKMAGGASCTHCRSSEVDLQLLAEAAGSVRVSGATLDRIRTANTVRHAFSFLNEKAAKKVCIRLADLVKSRVREQLGGTIRVQMMIWPFDREAPLCVC